MLNPAKRLNKALLARAHDLHIMHVNMCDAACSWPATRTIDVTCGSNSASAAHASLLAYAIQVRLTHSKWCRKLPSLGTMFNS
jgi:hypothetical protein